MVRKIIVRKIIDTGVHNIWMCNPAKRIVAGSSEYTDSQEKIKSIKKVLRLVK